MDLHWLRVELFPLHLQPVEWMDLEYPRVVGRNDLTGQGISWWSVEKLFS